MRRSYTSAELAAVVAAVGPRRGWDFTRMSVTRAPVPWDYADVVRSHLSSDSRVLDIGTGGGEQLAALAPSFGEGVGVDIDPAMVTAASQHAAGIASLQFQLTTAGLDGVDGPFDVVLSRHAPIAFDAVRDRLVAGGYAITQQVGERNMANVRAALGQPVADPPVSAGLAADAGLTVRAFAEYDVEYVVHDVGSLVFWLSALDLRHADIPGVDAVSSAEIRPRTGPLRHPRNRRRFRGTVSCSSDSEAGSGFPPVSGRELARRGTRRRRRSPGASRPVAGPDAVTAERGAMAARVRANRPTPTRHDSGPVGTGRGLE